jgi:hypothetical protein
MKKLAKKLVRAPFPTRYQRRYKQVKRLVTPTAQRPKRSKPDAKKVAINVACHVTQSNVPRYPGKIVRLISKR